MNWLRAERVCSQATGVAARLIGYKQEPFDLTTVKEFVDKCKHPNTKLSMPPLTVNQTRLPIEAVPSDKATGTDEISIHLLKIAAPALSPSLTELINLCISSGKFPSKWKEAKVTPLHKDGSIADKNNYRPISVLPVLSKVIEGPLHKTLIFSRIITYFIDFNLD